MFSGEQIFVKAQHTDWLQVKTSQISASQLHTASGNILKLESSDQGSGDRQYHINLSPFEYEQEEESRPDYGRKFQPGSDLVDALNGAISLSLQKNILTGIQPVVSGAAFRNSTRIFILLEVFRI